MTPVRLAAALEISDNTLREFLRRRFPRQKSEHGLAWSLTTEQIAAARDRYRASRQSSQVIRPATQPPANIIQLAMRNQRPLSSYIRTGLDVLFVALNPPPQSAGNGHWFSGKQSGFFKLLYLSGLISADISKSTADEIVFGGTRVNYKGSSYGVTDLRPDLVEVNSSNVSVGYEEVSEFIRVVRQYAPRIVCMIHQKVSTAFNKCMRRNVQVIDVAAVGRFTRPLAGCSSRFICNYFPNGNAYPDEVKIRIFRKIRSAIG